MANKDCKKPAQPAGKDALKEHVKKYLDTRAQEDPQFAEKYANPKKSIDECCRYIYGEAYARSRSGCCYIPPEEVYGMAVHYYDEADIKIRTLGNTRPTVHSAPADPVELTQDQKEKAEQAALEKYEAEARARIEKKEAERRKAEAEKKKAAREAAKRQQEAEGDLNLFNLFGI